MSDTNEIIDYKVVAFNIWTRKREVAIQRHSNHRASSDTNTQKLLCCSGVLDKPVNDNVYVHRILTGDHVATNFTILYCFQSTENKEGHFSHNIMQKERRMINKVSPSGTRLNSQLVNQCLLRKSFRLINFVAKNKQGNPS